jgi:3-hydroxymyristoyl/3-hydroxydecanoyl-(acyl carrier protein) dehydratase
MAQLAGVLLLRKLENTGKIAVLLSIEKVKLRRSVVPGDQLRVEAEALKVKSQAGKVKARVLVNGQLVSEAIMKFMLADA